MNRRQHRQQWQQLCDRRDVREKSCPSFPKLPSKRCKTTQIISFYFFIYYNLRLEILKNMVHNTWASPRNISSLRFLFWFSNDFLRSNHDNISLTLFFSNSPIRNRKFVNKWRMVEKCERDVKIIHNSKCTMHNQVK